VLLSYPSSRGMAAAAAAAAHDDVPALVRLLAGNPATSAAILSCLTADDTCALRRLHAAVAGAVAGVPWAGMDTRVVDAVRWRAAYPTAVGAKLVEGHCFSVAAVAALTGVAHLDLRNCYNVTNEVIRTLPTSLRSLTAHGWYRLTEGASFAHLPSLVSLDCKDMRLAADCLPPSLQELDVSNDADTTYRYNLLSAGTTLAHLSQLRVLRAGATDFDDATLARWRPCGREYRYRYGRQARSAAAARIQQVYWYSPHEGSQGRPMPPPSRWQRRTADGGGLDMNAQSPRQHHRCRATVTAEHHLSMQVSGRPGTRTTTRRRSGGRHTGHWRLQGSRQRHSACRGVTGRWQVGWRHHEAGRQGSDTGCGAEVCHVTEPRVPVDGSVQGRYISGHVRGARGARVRVHVHDGRRVHGHGWVGLPHPSPGGWRTAGGSPPSVGGGQAPAQPGAPALVAGAMCPP